ncbi:MAG: type II toxin-antitoxin system VapC family toxin [Gemmatimonadales bacterium]
MRDVLLDTGPLIAALDRSDQWHLACVDAWPDLVDRCVTTEAVVTEASHLVQRGGASAGLPLEFLLAARIPILGLELHLHRQAARLMTHYADLSMDYADATLVVLAQALQIATAFTTDRKGFAVYRAAHNREFDIVPM